MAIAGETCDRERFASYIWRTVDFQTYKNGYRLDLEATAQLTWTILAEALREGPYQTNALIGGIDEDGEAKMYWLDYLGTIQRVTKGGHGYAGYFTASVLDNAYKGSMTKDEGLEAIRWCIKEMKERFLMDQPHYFVKVITKDGVEVLEY